MELNPVMLVAEPAAFAAAVAVLRFWAPRLAAWRSFVIPVLVGVSAGAAGAAGAAPTRSALVDVLLLAALGGAGALAGLRARPALLLGGGLVAAGAGVDGAALPLALAATGLALASLLVEDEPLINSLAGALLVQAALRLTRPDAAGLTAVIAALILVPLFATAARTLDRPRRRVLSRVVLGAAGVALVGAAVGLVAGLSSVQPLRRGLAAATKTLDTTSSVDVEATAASLSDAQRNFARARRSLEAWWAWPARAVPVVAQHWGVLEAAALTGHELTEVGQRALRAPALRDIQVSGGRVPLDQLAAMEPAMADVAVHVGAGRERLDEARSSWLLPSVRDELDSHRRRMAGIQSTAELANQAIPLVPRLLGGDGPRRYFLAIQTPTEARGGGGFIGNFGEVTADGGRLALSRFGRQTDLTNAPGAADRTLHAPDDFLARYARFAPHLSWANVNLSPDFPTTARVIADLYPQSGGAPIDGVIAIDPAGLAAILRLVGPLEVPSWPAPITADNALQILLFDQYNRYELDTVDRPGRIDFLGEVAEEAWRRLTSGGLPPIPQMLAVLGQAVGEKHILLSSMDAEEQELFEDMDAAGRMAPVAGDFVGLVTQNASGNKIDYFLRREVDYRVRLDRGTGQLQASVKVMLHNEAPTSGISSTVIGNQLRPPLPPGTNKLYLSFYTPWELTAARIDGTPVKLERATELGRRVYSSGLVVPAQSTVIVELDLAGRLPDGDSYRLDVHRQPMVAPDLLSASLTVVDKWPLREGGTRHTTRTELHSDRTIEVDLRRN